MERMMRAVVLEAPVPPEALKFAARSAGAGQARAVMDAGMAVGKLVVEL